MRGITVSLRDVVDEFSESVSVIYGKKYLSRRYLKSADLNRPGLILTGFTREFPSDRLQIMGLTERTYLLHILKNKGKEGVYASLETFFSKKIPGVVLTAAGKKLDDFLLSLIIDMAKKYRTPVLSTSLETTAFISMLGDRLSYLLAPRTTVHGVMVEIFGVGVLIVGKAGAGKTETALEIVRRGHGFIADDVVMIRRYPPNALLAEPPTGREDLMLFMFVRGVGTIYVPHYFGVGAVRGSYPLHVIVELTEEGKERMEEEDLLGVRVPKYHIKLHPLKATATVIESVALHYKANSLKDLIHLPSFNELLEKRLRK